MDRENEGRMRNAESDRGNEAVSIMKAVKIGEQDFAGRIHVSEVAARVGNQQELLQRAV